MNDWSYKNAAGVARRRGGRGKEELREVGSIKRGSMLEGLR